MNNPFLALLKNLADRLGVRHVLRKMGSPVGRMEGVMEVLVHDQHGYLIHYDRGKNVVLDGAKGEIMRILNNDAVRETGGVVRSISRFVVGDGGAEPASLSTPKTLDKTRSSLFNEVHRKDITSFIYPQDNAIEFTVDILSSDLSAGDFNPANGGEFLNEAGLMISLPGTYTAGHPLTGGVVGPDDFQVTHKTFKSFPFTPGLSITATFKWTLFNVL